MNSLHSREGEIHQIPEYYNRWQKKTVHISVNLLKGPLQMEQHRRYSANHDATDNLRIKRTSSTNGERLLVFSTLPFYVYSLQQYSNSYSNADDRQHYLATHSEQQGQEISSWRTPANTSEQAQAHPVFGNIQLITNHNTDHIQDMISFCEKPTTVEQH